MDVIVTFIEDFQNLLLDISGSAAVIGVLGLAIMYLGSPLPLIGDWKRDHPRATSDIIKGLFFLILASGGSVAALLGT